jgi:hypothetical protein
MCMFPISIWKNHFGFVVLGTLKLASETIVFHVLMSIMSQSGIQIILEMGILR